jgi:hypothetical protein
LSRPWAAGPPTPFFATGGPLKTLPRVMPRTFATVPFFRTPGLGPIGSSLLNISPPVFGASRRQCIGWAVLGFIHLHHPRPFALEDRPFLSTAGLFHTPKSAAIPDSTTLHLYTMYSYLAMQHDNQTRWKDPRIEILGDVFLFGSGALSSHDRRPLSSFPSPSTYLP